MYGVGALYTHIFLTLIWQQLNVLPATNFLSPINVLTGWGFSGYEELF